MYQTSCCYISDKFVRAAELNVDAVVLVQVQDSFMIKPQRLRNLWTIDLQENKNKYSLKCQNT